MKATGHWAILASPYWLCFLLACCNAKSEGNASCDAIPEVLSNAGVVQLAARFGRDPTFRRNCLERSLVNQGNGYSQVRLKRYNGRGWGSLALAAFKTRPIVPADLGKPIPAPDATWGSFDDGPSATSREALLQRGKQMFSSFPAQIERSMIPILRDQQGPARYGLWQTSDSIGGLVWVALPGGVFPALTCSSCHSSVGDAGQLQLGVPNHQIDLGKAKDDYTGMKSLYSTWGPGRVDVAADDKDNPVVIADVRAVRFQTHLHRTANVKNSLVALALRVETGLILAHYEAVRPTPEDSFALAYYLWSLGDGFDVNAPQHHPARSLFEKHCASCHEGPGHAGKPVLASAIESPTAAMPSASRGTGKVQTSSLLGVSGRRRLLYGGAAQSIEALLDPRRTAGGHYLGKELTDAERRSIQGYLESL